MPLKISDCFLILELWETKKTGTICYASQKQLHPYKEMGGHYCGGAAVLPAAGAATTLTVASVHESSGILAHLYRNHILVQV